VISPSLGIGPATQAGTGPCSGRYTCPTPGRESEGHMLKFLRNVIVLRQIWRMWKGRRRG
jgi:hypothetical protein